MLSPLEKNIFARPGSGQHPERGSGNTYVSHAMRRQILLVLDATEAMAPHLRSLLDDTVWPLLERWLGEARTSTEAAFITVRDESTGWGAISPFTTSPATLRRWLDAVPLHGGLDPPELLCALTLVASAVPWTAARECRHVLLLTASVPLPLPTCTDPEAHPFAPVPEALAASGLSLSVISPVAAVNLAALHSSCARPAPPRAPAPVAISSDGPLLLLAPALDPAAAAAAAAAPPPPPPPPLRPPPRGASPATPQVVAAGPPSQSPRSASPAGGMTKLWEGALLLSRPEGGADEVGALKMGIKSDDPLRERWRTAARGWPRALTISDKRAVEAAPPQGDSRTTVRFVVWHDEKRAAAALLAKLLSSQARLAGEFGAAQVFIDTDPSQASRKQCHLCGWLTSA